jgi:hypothetical protein
MSRMETRKMVFYVMTICLILVMSISCGGVNGAKEEVRGDDDLQDEIVDVDRNYFWVEYVTSEFRFLYPVGWHVEFSQSTAGNGKTSYHFLVKNTEKRIVLGGVAPDEYCRMENDVNQINPEFASEYVAFDVHILQNDDNDWSMYFSKNFDGVVDEYDSENGFVEISELSGVLFGRTRLFFRNEEYVFDAGLFCSSKYDCSWSEEMFSQFINSFNQKGGNQ